MNKRVFLFVLVNQQVVNLILLYICVCVSPISQFQTKLVEITKLGQPITYETTLIMDLDFQIVKYNIWMWKVRG